MCQSLALRDWDALLREAKAANLLARLAIGIEAQGLLGQMAEQVHPHLIAAIRLSLHQIDAIQWECRHLDRALQRVESPVLLLKGAAYAMSGLNAARGRLFGDIDLLVSVDHLRQAESGLLEWGWSAGTLDPYDERYYRRWMHELPPMAHRQRGTTIDLHHNILPRTARHMPDAGKILRTHVPLPNCRLGVPAPADLVIHSAVHLFHEGESTHALRDLLDLQSLIDEFQDRDPDFWRLLCDRAAELRLTWPLALAIRYLRLVLGRDVPDSVESSLLTASRFGSVRLRRLDAMYMPVFLDDATGNADLRSSVAEYALYVRGHALRMPMHLLLWHLGRKAVLRMFKSNSRV